MIVFLEVTLYQVRILAVGRCDSFLYLIFVKGAMCFGKDLNRIKVYLKCKVICALQNTF